jgi:hypothetical protein
VKQDSRRSASAWTGSSETSRRARSPASCAWHLARADAGPDDRLIKTCAGLLLEPSAARDRLTEGVFLGTDDDGVARLERACELVVACEPLRKKLKEAGIEDIAAALEEDVIDDAEAVRLREREAAVRRVVMVDDFAPEELSPGAPHQGERPSRSRQRRAVPSMS